MSTVKKETKVVRAKVYEQYAWVLPLVLGILGIVFGSIVAFSGEPPEQETFANIAGLTWQEAQTDIAGVAKYITITLQSEGQFIVGFGVLITAITVFPYRRGEQWAWYTLWLLPVFYSILAVRVFVVGGMGWNIILVQLGIILIGLLLPYRKFFPKKI